MFDTKLILFSFLQLFQNSTWQLLQYFIYFIYYIESYLIISLIKKTTFNDNFSLPGVYAENKLALTLQFDFKLHFW